MANKLDISERVKREIAKSRKSGKSLYRIAKDADLPYQTAHRFVSGGPDGHNLTIANLEKLIDALGLKLDLIPKRGRK